MGIYERKPIYHAYNLVSDTLFYIQLTDETIRSTKDHPFLSKRGWIEATSLLVGDSLLTQTGNYIAIVRIEKKLEHENVYNFEVKDYHTYFIGKNKVVVHNSLGGPCKVLGGETSGFYRISEKGGKVYIGKVKFDRAKRSLSEKGDAGEWWSVDKGFGNLTVQETAFVYEHLLLNQHGGIGGGTTKNIINSPGKKLFDKLSPEEQKAITEQFNKTVGSKPETMTKRGK